MKLDVLFYDIACCRPYNYDSLENDSLGGTECSTIRLAEGFATKGLKVAIVQPFDFIASQSPAGVHYLPKSWLTQLKPTNVIHLRNRRHLDVFPNAKQFIWLHDAVTEGHNNNSDWAKPMIEKNVTGVCVSNWHKSNILSLCPDMPLVRIYSPVDEVCYDYTRPNKIDIDQLVWMSSPHKGLGEALMIFAELRKLSPEFKLAVFNPGYYLEDQGKHENVVFISKVKRKALRSVLSQSLCLFYPTVFEETFGLVAAESNCLGTPVAHWGVAALTESSVDKPIQGIAETLEMILQWRRNRPVVTGQYRFRFENIWQDWYKLLNL